MKRCVRCKTLRQEGSFYTDGTHPDDNCKPCIHRPRRTRVRVLRSKATELERTQAAIRYVLKHMQMNSELFVYLIKVENNYKIGYSNSVDRRVRQLETASSATVQLIAVAPGGRQLEQDLHHQFRGIRIRGEWFSASREDKLIECFDKLPNSMVFLPGYVKQDAPLDAIE